MKLKMKPLSILALVVALSIVGCVAKDILESRARKKQRHMRWQIAEAKFQERCKTAGKKIYRTVDNVDRVFLLKLRPAGMNSANQFALDDPYGRDLSGTGYIHTFVRGSYRANTKNVSANRYPQRIGYLYVEAIDLEDGQRYRYTGGMKEVTHTSRTYVRGEAKTTFKTRDFVLDKVPASNPAPRYGITFDDISTREDREHWIAGSSLKIIDLQTNEVMAERIGYMMDPGQGMKAGGRSPWLAAADHACPAFAPHHGARAQAYQALDFTEEVLKPVQDN